MKIVLSFSLLNLLLSLVLYFLEIDLWKTIFISVIFFFILFLKISFLTKIANKKEIDTLVVAYGLNIGLKFLFSLVFVSVMYVLGIFEGKIPIIIFMFYYYIYTFLMARYGVNKLL